MLRVTARLATSMAITETITGIHSRRSLVPKFIRHDPLKAESDARRSRFITLCRCCVENKKTESARVKYWEIIANNLSKAGWSWGCVTTLDRKGHTIFAGDAHCGDGKRFILRVDEKLTAFPELESVR